MQVLDSVACADVFPTQVGKGASLGFVYGSNGGYAAVGGADVFVQLAYGVKGEERWTDAMHVSPGNIVLAPGTIGIAFRNYVAGVNATVSAGLSERTEPPLTPTAAGVSTVAGAKINGLTGSVSAAGAIVAGTGFTVAHPGAGAFQVTFTPALTAAPIVVVSVIDAAAAHAYAVLVTTPTNAGFNVDIFDPIAVAFPDKPWNFIAIEPQ